MALLAAMFTVTATPPHGIYGRFIFPQPKHPVNSGHMVIMPEPQKLNFIDAFRGWAALGVVAVHSGLLGNPPEWLKPLVSAGARGVQLFFIISAFTLFYSLANRVQYEKRPLAAFFIRRFFRIAPLFYVVMIFSIFWGSTGPSYWAPHGVSSLGVFLTAIFMNGWYPDFVTSVVSGGWSIAVEMNFYLLLPLLFLRIKRVMVAMACIPVSYYAGMYIARKIANIYRHRYDQDTMYVLDAWQYMLSLPSELYVFFFGILVFLIWHKCGWIFEIFSHATYLKIFYFFLLLLITVIYIKPKMSFVVLLFACIVLVGSAVNSPLTQGRIIRFIGKISYSLYFSHFFAIRFIGGVPDGFGDWLVGFIQVLAISIPAAFLGHTFIEKPCQKLGGKLINKYIN
jgi:peptidoglycan/LPS O-acetylase OafA/YrhL